MKTSRLIYLLTFLLAIGVSGCSDDEPKPADKQEKPIDITDPEAIAETLTFENGEATVVKEAFPAPTEEVGAPVLYEDEDNEEVLAISGGKLSLDINTSTDVKGAYVQVNGTDHYYDIKFYNTKSNGRTFNTRNNRISRSTSSTRMQRVESLLITLPAGLEAGDFCLTYAVYDEQNRVSNAIEICVEVASHGGENSSFLTDNEWAMVAEYWTETDNGETDYDTTIVGKIWEEHYETEIYCSDAVYESFPAVHKYALNYSYLTFSPDGTISRELEEYSRQVDREKSSCEEGLAYEEDTETWKDSGSWAYDDSKKELTLVLLHTETDEMSIITGPDGTETTETYTEIYTKTEVYRVHFENGTLTLTKEETDEWGTSRDIVIFEPKD